MSRTEYDVVVQSYPMTVTRQTIICDQCGAVISRDDEMWFANELEILLNPQECVSSQHTRDYCNNCLEPIWLGICELIGADPDASR